MPTAYLLFGLAGLAIFIIVLMVVTLAPLFRRSARAKISAGLVGLADYVPPEPDQGGDDADAPFASRKSKPSSRRASSTRQSANDTSFRQRRGPPQAVAVSLRLPVQFQYTMPNGSRHLRHALVVTALGCAKHGGVADVTMLRCICGATKQWRTFEVARIADLVDLQTGELVRSTDNWIMEQTAPWPVRG